MLKITPKVRSIFEISTNIRLNIEPTIKESELTIKRTDGKIKQSFKNLNLVKLECNDILLNPLTNEVHKILEVDKNILHINTLYGTQKISIFNASKFLLKVENES